MTKDLNNSMNEPETKKDVSASSIGDLPVTQEEAEEAKGGGLNFVYGKLDVKYLEQDPK